MANERNLIKNEDLTPSERRKNASKAGKASAKARQKRKSLKEELLLLLEVGDTQQSVTLALLEKAKAGDTKAFEVIRDTIGEKPVDRLIVSEVDADVVSEVEAMVNAE